MEMLKKTAIRSMIRLMRNHRAAMERRLESTGVFQAQHKLLMEIAANPNRSQKELADRMEVSTATIAVSLKKLEKGGFVARAADVNDTRFNQVVLTEKGRTAVEQSIEIFREIDEKTFEGFSEDEINEFLSYIRRITENVKKI